MTDELIVIKDVTGKLDKAEIPYMITGSIAMSLYVIPRMTRDIDIVIQISSEEIETILELFSGEYYISREGIQEAIKERTMFNIIHNETLVKVDFVIKKATIYRTTEFKRRCKIDIDSMNVWVVSKEDLILSKLVWAKDSRSSIQLQDIRLLLETNFDKAYVMEWATQLEVSNLLAEIII